MAKEINREDNTEEILTQKRILYDQVHFIWKLPGTAIFFNLSAWELLGSRKALSNCGLRLDALHRHVNSQQSDRGMGFLLN